MGSPVKSLDAHLFPEFSEKRHGKIRHIMGSHGICRHFHGKVRAKGGGGVTFEQTILYMNFKIKCLTFFYTTLFNSFLHNSV
jgi:hypothetical protein